LDDAETLFVEALGIARDPQSGGGRFLGRVLVGYGRCLTGLESFPGSEAALLEAHEVLLASEPARARTAVRGLVELYEAWQQPDRADEWRSRLE
jgi:hypothetical protein